MHKVTDDLGGTIVEYLCPLIRDVNPWFKKKTLKTGRSKFMAGPAGI